MSGGDYGGGERYGRNSYRGGGTRRGVDRRFDGGSNRGRSDYESDNRNDYSVKEDNDDGCWDDNPSQGNSSYSHGGSGRGYISSNQRTNQDYDNDEPDNRNDNTSNYRGAGRGVSNRGGGRGRNFDNQSNGGGGGYGRNFDNDNDGAGRDSRKSFDDRYGEGGGDRRSSNRGRGRNFDNDNDDQGTGSRRSFGDRYGGGDDNRRADNRGRDRNYGDDNNEDDDDTGRDSRKSFGDRYGGDNESRRGGGGRGRRGGRGDHHDSQNSFSRRRNDDASPSRSDDGDRRGGRRGGGDDAENKEKPRENYIPPDPTDDEELMFSSGITSGINFSKYENIKVKVSGENPVLPIPSFEKAGLRELVYSNVKKSGYKTPTPIQKYALPAIMMGRDLMACAQTGSGKTAAFLIPMINTLIENPSDLIITSSYVEPQAIILSPTRELAIQIFQEARKFAHGSIIKVAMAYGGTSTSHQVSVLMRGCHILVATPGRLNDFVNRNNIKFSSVRFFVLDEADRMLDMGFKSEIEKMLDHESMIKVGDRQTMMFSATFPDEIQRLAQLYLNDYLFIVVGIVGGACADVQQIIYEVARFDKKEKLKELLSKAEDGEKTLVFVEQKRTADFIAALLSENGFPTTSIHGDRLQSQRESALNDFKVGRMPTLVATAVAARGLDIKNVNHVINYDLPSTIEEYVHRIGRTGRVGNRGKATSFYDSGQDSQIASQLVTILEQTSQEVPEFLSSDRSLGGGGFRNNNDGEGFGGHDFRRGPTQSYQLNRGPQPQEEAEEW